MSMVRNVSIVLRGTMVAQAIGFLALPFMARLLPVEAFGQFQVYQSVLAVGFVFTAMRYELALLRCRGEAELRATIQLCIVINVAFAALAGLFYEIVRQLDWSSTISNWAFGGVLLTVGLLFGGLTQTLSHLVTRAEAFREGANVKLVQSTAYAGTGIGFGFALPTQSGLIWADMGGRAASTVILFAHIRRLGVSGLGSVRPSRMLAMARKFRHYAMLTVPGSLLSAFSIALVPIAVFSLYGAATAGQVGLVERAITLPINLLALAVMQVFTAKLAKELRAGGGEARHMFRQMLMRLAAIGLLPAIAGFWIAPHFILFAFGPEWQLAAEIAQLFMVYHFVSFVAGGIIQSLDTAGAQRQQMLWEVGRFSSVLVVWAVVMLMGIDLKLALALHYGVHILAYAAYVLIADRVLAHPGTPTPQPTPAILGIDP